MTAGPTLSLAHSPDADDLVMWWPLTGQHRPDGTPVDGPLGAPAIDPSPWRFRTVPDDVERLNGLARALGAGELRPDAPEAYDISAISCATYPACCGVYRITACGGSFGEGYGPKIVVRAGTGIEHPLDLRGRRVAVPGLGTTAMLTLSLLLDSRADAPAFEAVPMLFSDVPSTVARGDCDAGLLIHEAQLTFEHMGLRPLGDLGRWWGDETGLPLPLGLNVIRRDLDARFGAGTVASVAALLARSVAHARTERAASRAFLRLHEAVPGREKPEWADASLVDRYLDMYVSAMTQSMGDRGRLAIERLLHKAAARGLCADPGAIDVV